MVFGHVPLDIGLWMAAASAPARQTIAKSEQRKEGKTHPILALVLDSPSILPSSRLFALPLSTGPLHGHISGAHEALPHKVEAMVYVLALGTQQLIRPVSGSNSVVFVDSIDQLPVNVADLAQAVELVENGDGVDRTPGGVFTGRDVVLFRRVDEDETSAIGKQRVPGGFGFRVLWRGMSRGAGEFVGCQRYCWYPFSNRRDRSVVQKYGREDDGRVSTYFVALASLTVVDTWRIDLESVAISHPPGPKICTRLRRWTAPIALF